MFTHTPEAKSFPKDTEGEGMRGRSGVEREVNIQANTLQETPVSDKLLF